MQNRGLYHENRSGQFDDFFYKTEAASEQEILAGLEILLRLVKHPVIGYDKASAIAHRALKQNTTLREAALSGGFINAEDFDRVVDPKKMVGYPQRDLGILNSDSHV